MNQHVHLYRILVSSFLIGSLFVLPFGCNQKEKEQAGAVPGKQEATAPHSHENHHEGEEHSHDHSHTHTAPHGGTLVIMGDHFAILEIVLDKALGKMTAYVLDGEAEKPVRIAQSAIDILIVKAENSSQGNLLKLNAVANTLTGETAGDTSEFHITSELLKGKDHFDGIIQSVTIKGEEIKSVSFKFPEGNE